MALSDFALEWPAFSWGSALNSTAMDASGEALCAHVVIPKAGNITKIGFRTGSVSVSDSLDIKIETLDASCNPSGTAYKGCTAATLGTVAANTFYLVTLGTAASSVVAGDRVVVTFRWTSYVSGNVTIQGNNVAGSQQVGNNQLEHYNGSAWAGTATFPIIWFEYDDASVAVPPNGVVGANTTNTFNSGSSPDERGVYIASMPFTGRCIGARVKGSASASATVKLYDGSSSLLASEFIDANHVVSASAAYYLTAFWPAGVTLSQGNAYRCSVLPYDTTNCNYNYLLVNAASLMAFLPGGTNVIGTTRADAGTWSNQDTQRPAVTLLFDQIDWGGAGGGPVFGGMVVR